MQWIRFAALVVFAAVLQAGGLPDAIALTRLNARPDFLLILLVFFAVYYDGSDAVICSFAIGFAADLAGPAMGPGMISFGLFGTALAYLKRVIAIRRIPLQAAAIFVTSFLVGLTVALLGVLTPPGAGQGRASGVLAGALLGMSIYTAVLGPFLFAPLAWWMNVHQTR